MEKIKLVLGILLGFTLSFFNASLLKNSTTKTDEQYIVTNSRNVFILDSVEFKLTADSVLLYGNENSYTELLYHYGSIHNGSKELLYYALIMADKYSYPEASYNIFGIIKDFNKNNTLLLSEMMRYYLLYGAKNGSSSSCFQLKEYYEKGILFERNQRKAKFYENKINEIYKIKWTK